MFALLIYVGYIALWLLLVFLASFISWKLFKSKAVSIIAGLVAFGIMYWPAFGDFIPALQTHKQLCEKEAGFTVYVTPEQWAEENPGVLEALTPNVKIIFENHILMGNERIGFSSKKEKAGSVYVQKLYGKVVDTKTNKILAEYIDFSRGYGQFGVSDNIGSVKFWLYKKTCFSADEFISVSNEKDIYLEKLKFK